VSKWLGLALAAPFLIAAGRANDDAVRLVLAKIIVGETLPEAILDRQLNTPKFPDLDQAIAKAKGCKVSELEPLQNGQYGVQWKCKGGKAADQPSAMVIYAKDGQVTRITTALVY